MANSWSTIHSNRWSVCDFWVWHTFHVAEKCKMKRRELYQTLAMSFLLRSERAERAQTFVGAPSDLQIFDLLARNELEFPQINGVFMLHRALAAAHSRAGRTPTWPQKRRWSPARWTAVAASLRYQYLVYFGVLATCKMLLDVLGARLVILFR